MTLEDKVHATRLLALQRAEAFGNVSEACRALGISRSLFYRWKDRFERYGRDGLHPRRQGAGRGRPPGLSVQDEQAILAMALSYPTCGPCFYSLQLVRNNHRYLSSSTIYRALPRMGLGTRQQRLVVLEQHSAWRAGLLTERTRRQLARARGQRRHVEAKEPGELVCLDTFYIGRLKGVGKVWQITACDAACSYATARIVPANTAEHAARFLVDVLLPLYEAAQDGRFSESSPIGVASLGVSLMPSVKTWRSAIRARNPGTRGPMVSSNVFRERSSTSIGVWPSAGDTSRSVVSSSGLCKSTWPSTTMNGLIKDIEHAASGQPTSSGVLKAAL